MDHSEPNKNNFITCGVCKKIFKTKSYLNVHKRIHSGENPYKCDVCQKGFSVKSNLTKHILVHRYKTIKINSDISKND